MKKAIYFVWKAVEGKSGVKVKMASRGKYGSPKMVENPDGLDIIDKAPTRLFFSGISKEQLQVAVDKAIAKQKAAIDKDQKYKAAAPARKAEAAKYQAEKRKNNLAEYEKKYGKGTWNRVTYKQEGGDDGYSYVLRVDGRSKYSGLTQREAMYYKELEVDKLAKAAGLGKYAKQSPTVKESVEDDEVKSSNADRVNIYFKEVVREVGRSLKCNSRLLKVKSGEDYRIADFDLGDLGIIRIEMTWDRDGTSGKPVTRVYVNVSGKDVGKLNAGWAGDDWDFGRVSIIWDDPGMLARMIVNKLNDEDLLESVEEDEVKASAEKLKDLLISRKWENVKIRPATAKEVKRINDTFKASFNFNIDSALVVEAVALSANVKTFVFDSAKGVRFWVRSNAGGDLSGTVEVAASSVAIQTEKLTWRDLENR
jgi:hypothetical protein